MYKDFSNYGLTQSTRKVFFDGSLVKKFSKYIGHIWMYPAPWYVLWFCLFKGLRYTVSSITGFVESAWRKFCIVSGFYIWMSKNIKLSFKKLQNGRVHICQERLNQVWVRSQHPSAQWNLRGGRWSSAEYCTNKKKKKSPKKIFKKKKFALPPPSPFSPFPLPLPPPPRTISQYWPHWISKVLTSESTTINKKLLRLTFLNQ